MNLPIFNLLTGIDTSDCNEKDDFQSCLKGYLENKISIDTFSPYLQKLIYDSCCSNNEMWFVEVEDEFYSNMLLKTNGLFELELQNEVVINNLQDYIIFNEYGCSITVFGGIIDKIDF